jgi:hypothetical protein
MKKVNKFLFLCFVIRLPNLINEIGLTSLLI